MVKRKRLGKSILALLMTLCLLAGTVQTSTVVYAAETEEFDPSEGETLVDSEEENEGESDEEDSENEESADAGKFAENPAEAEQVEDASEEELTEAEKVQEDQGLDEQIEETVEIQEGESETNIDLEYVQGLIDSLPNADDITKENAADVEALLDEIDEAKQSLTAEELDSGLNYTKYEAAVAALEVLAGGVASVAVVAADGSPADALTDKEELWSTLTNPDEDKTGDVTLTVITTEGETKTYQYANIMDAVKKLFSYMNHGDNYQTTSSYSATTTWYNPNGRGYCWSDVDYTWDYTSAVISFTGEHCEYITTSVKFKSSTSGWQYASLSNVTFDGNGTGSIVGDSAESWTGDVVVSGGTYGNAYGYGSYSDLKGTLTISGDNCTIQNINFVGNHTWAFTYYTQDNAIGVGSGVTGLTIKNNSFSGYTLVTAFGQSGGTVTNEVFTGNTVENCLFLFHTADGGATNLTVTNNTLIGSPTYTLASCMASSTLADFSGNTLTYASFGLQNCETDMEQFLNQNTYNHGFIYQETVDYSWTDEELGNDTYYYLPSSTTVMTVVPDGYYAIWKSDYNTAKEMDTALTYTQQDAIDDACETSEDTTYAKITWTGGGRDENGNLLDGGVAIGYNYTATHLDYLEMPVLMVEKTVGGEASVSTDRFKFEVTAPEQAGETVTVISGTKDEDTYTATQTREVTIETNGTLNIWLKANEYVKIYGITSYTVKEVINGGYASSVTGETSGTIDAAETKVVSFNNNKDSETTTETSNEPELAKTATELDENYETTVTLTVAGSQETQNVAVLFVLDYSTSITVREAAEDMLKELAKKNNVDLKVAVVNYYANAEVYDWVTFDEDTDISVLLKPENEGGTNYHAGLLAAEDLLMSDEINGYTTYLITISDGITYLWTDEVTGVTEAVYTSMWSPSVYDEATSTKWNDNQVNTYREINSERVDDLVSATDEVIAAYKESANIAVPWGTAYSTGMGYVSYDDFQNHTKLTGSEVAIYKTAETYRKLVDSVDYAYAFKMDEEHWTAFPYGEYLMNYLISQSANKNTDGEITNTTAKETFSTIKNQILYTIQSGTVTDVIGNDFDLKSVDTFTMTVNGDQMTGTVSGDTINFGTADENGVYPYTVTYSENAAEGEQFIWSINVPVEMEAEIKLTYVLKLVNISTTAGTYGTYDEDGSEGYSNIKTNESAELEYTPTDGDPETKPFPEPTVSYTVPETEEPADTAGTTDPTETSDTETAETVVEDPADPQEAESTVAAEVVSAVTGDNAPIGIAILIAAISEVTLITLIVLQMRKKERYHLSRLTDISK